MTMSSRENNEPVQPSTNIIVDVIIESSDEEQQNEIVLNISSDDSDTPQTVSPQSRRARFRKSHNLTAHTHRPNSSKKKVLRKRAYRDTSQEQENILASPTDKNLVRSFFGPRKVAGGSSKNVGKSG